MKSFIIFVKELPKPVKYSSFAYIGCLLIYNASGSYIDAKQYLEKYRENQLTNDEKNEIKSDWDAVKYGANLNCVRRLWDSIIWPVTITNNIIPWLVLTFNKKAD